MDNTAAIDNMFSHLPSENDVTSESASEEKQVDTTPETKEEKSEVNTKSDENTKSDTSDDIRGEDSEKEVPFHEHPRFKQLIKDKNSFRDSDKAKTEQITKLEEEIRDLKTKRVTDEELEGKSPTEIRKILEEQMQSEHEYKQKISQRESEEAERYIDESLQDLKDGGHEFDENELLKLSADYTEGDIQKAFEIYQKLNQNKTQGANEENKRQAKLKQSESNTSNRKSNSSTGGYVKGQSWGDLRSQMS